MLDRSAIAPRECVDEHGHEKSVFLKVGELKGLDLDTLVVSLPFYETTVRWRAEEDQCLIQWPGLGCRLQQVQKNGMHLYSQVRNEFRAAFNKVCVWR